MTNKERLKKAIEQDINLKDYYNEIINQIEERKRIKMKKKNNMWNFSLIPICLIVAISGVLFLNYQNDNKTFLKSKTYVDKENNIMLNINELDSNKVGAYKIDADVKIVTNNGFNFPLPYKDELVDLPKDLDKNYKYIFYFRENKESKDYNILGNYEIEYSNDNDRSIQIKYSKDYKPVRDYYFSDEGSKTTINDIELKIYKFESIYFTEFEFNGYNFDIETFKITEQELLDFLLSILK